MGISELLTDIGEGIGTFLPALVKALLDGFVNLFFTTATEGGAITGLSALGIVSVVFIIIGMCKAFLPGILAWFRTKWKSRGSRRAKRAR